MPTARTNVRQSPRRIPRMKTQPGARRAGRGAIAGLLAGAVAVGAGQLAAGITGAGGSPVVAVGQLQIDFTPAWLKNFAISEFGSHDKLVLVSGILVVLALFAAVLGSLAMRRLGGDELLLAAVQMRRGDQDMGDRVGQRRPAVAADEVQAHADADRRAGAGDDSAAVEAERLRPDPHPRILGGESAPGCFERHDRRQ